MNNERTYHVNCLEGHQCTDGHKWSNVTVVKIVILIAKLYPIGTSQSIGVRIRWKSSSLLEKFVSGRISAHIVFSWLSQPRNITDLQAKL